MFTFNFHVSNTHGASFRFSCDFVCFLTYKICNSFLSNKVCVYSILNKALNEFHRNKPGTLMRLPVCFKIVRFVTSTHFFS